MRGINVSPKKFLSYLLWQRRLTWCKNIWRHMSWCSGDMRRVHHPKVINQVHPRLQVSLNIHTHFHSLAILEDIRVVARVIWGQCTTLRLLHHADGHHRAPGTTLASYQGLITTKTMLLPFNLFLTIYIIFRINRYAATYPSYYITTVWYYIIFQSYIIYRDFLIEPRFGE